jgi:hypothetical protein
VCSNHSCQIYSHRKKCNYHFLIQINVSYFTINLYLNNFKMIFYEFYFSKSMKKILPYLHNIPTSSWWPQLSIPQPLCGHWNKLVSDPVHFTLSKSIGNVPRPKCAALKTTGSVLKWYHQNILTCYMFNKQCNNVIKIKKKINFIVI